jgi:hypothetical protein
MNEEKSDNEDNENMSPNYINKSLELNLEKYMK